MPKNKFFESENRLLLAAYLLLLTSVVIIGSFYAANQINNQDKNTSIVLTAQQTAVSDTLTASVKGIYTNPDFDPAFTLDESETMLILTLSITNKTESEKDFIPTNDLYVRTREGDYRPLHPSIRVNNPIKAGKIKPGETFSGQVSFAVPKSAPRILFYIDTQWESTVPVVFDVFKQS